jgi:CheY-like chemotaxis protein
VVFEDLCNGHRFCYTQAAASDEWGKSNLLELERSMAKPRVLVVDDNPSVVDVICRMLRIDGTYEAVKAYNGIEALEMVETTQPICIVIDAKMPGLDGFQLLRALRGDERSANIALVMLTALVQPQDEMRGIFSGADIYLTKPFRSDALMDAIARAIAITPAQRMARFMALQERFLEEEAGDL